MKKGLLYVLVLCLPFLGMIVTNEWVSANNTEHHHRKYGVAAINGQEKLQDQCSWFCHHDTDYCKANHVKYATPYFDQIDPVYFGIIGGLTSSGNYRLANVIILVVAIPLFLFFLLMEAIRMQYKIQQLKKADT